MEPTKTIILDIETMPAPVESIIQVCPKFDAPANYKDQEKIEAYKREQFLKWLERAALDASTGRIAAIGMLEMDSAPREILLFHDTDGGEAGMLDQAWKLIDQAHLVTFNGFRFDLPYMFRRSWAAKVNPPTDRVVHGRLSNDPDHTDLMQAYGLGVSGEMHSLDTVAKCLGAGQKSGRGDMFHKLYNDPNTRESAVNYLRNDLALTLAVARAMSIC